MKQAISLILAAIFMFSLVGCVKNVDNDSAPATIPAQPISTDHQTPELAPMTDEERLKEQFFQAEAAFAWFTGNNTPEMDGKKTTEVNGKVYYRVAEKRLNNRLDLEKYISARFDSETVTKLMGTKVSGGNLYTEFKGDLYIYGGYVSQLAHDIGEYKFKNVKIDGDDASFTLEYTANPDGSPIYDYLLLLDYKAKLVNRKWQFIDFKLPVVEFVKRANSGVTPFPPTPTTTPMPVESEMPPEPSANPDIAPGSERIPSKGIIPQASEVGAVSEISITDQNGTSLLFEKGSVEQNELVGLLRSIEATEVPHPYPYEAANPVAVYSIAITYDDGSQMIVSSGDADIGFFRNLTSFGSQGDRGYIYSINATLYSLIVKYFGDAPAIASPSVSPSASPLPPENEAPENTARPGEGSEAPEVPEAIKPVSPSV